ncbi:tautomerase [Chania multitudinisentens RB-25]|uniref:Tautomerase n=1 Tax=Chania multitudinisentens RB-25 TaxID=1441930 RepID=W0LA83_9GAMM|nr:tautomerase family protein [Chania multitudinisentens]AHG20743.1 tautomerase [Chania multitudinisentens RB-25]
MPLLRIEVIKGRTEDELQVLLQIIHDTMISSFGVPERDRYQVLTEHDTNRMLLEDTGLGFKRSHKIVLIQMITRKRSTDEKQRFYSRVVQRLEEQCQISPEDVVISCVENGDADWSFGYGRAQFLNGDL